MGRAVSEARPEQGEAGRVHRLSAAVFLLRPRSVVRVLVRLVQPLPPGRYIGDCVVWSYPLANNHELARRCLPRPNPDGVEVNILEHHIFTRRRNSVLIAFDGLSSSSTRWGICASR